MPRVCMLGLDCLAPQLVFDRFWADLPNLRGLAMRGLAGPLMSCDPPITVPAWAAMMTGEDPGSLGLYGFHDRSDRSYHRRHLASSMSYSQLPLWTRLSRAGVACRILALPQTYPPKPINGYMVTGCLTPSHIGIATYPEHLKHEVQSVLGRQALDIPDFRSLAPAALLQQVQQQTDALWTLACQWAELDDWQFFALVDMGPDRLHHGLWQLCIPDHPGFSANPLQHALRDYYVQLDRWIGAVLQRLRPGDVVLVLSDHGAQAMQGGVAVNEWLMRQGYLHMHSQGAAGEPFDVHKVDWSQTRVWADGGYAARLYFNIAGREPEGIVAATEVPALWADLQRDVQALPRAGNRPHRLLQPERIYRQVRGVAPDALLYLSNLQLRALGSLGHPQIFSATNDTGADGANHAHAGTLILRDGGGPRSAQHSLYDVAPTILQHLGVPVPATMLGHAIAASCGRKEEPTCQDSPYG